MSRKMLTNTILPCAVMLGVLICLGPKTVFAQNAAKARTEEAIAKKSAEAAASAEAEAKAKAESEAPRHADAYRVDFSINEMEDGKKINTRQYSMNSRSGDWNEIKIGTRVPVESAGNEGKTDFQFQYLDVGTNIRCRLTDQADMTSMSDGIMVSATADVTNFATPDQQGQRLPPAIRQLRISASTIAPLGKPMVVGVVDDPNSKRQFQLEVMVTKLR